MANKVYEFYDGLPTWAKGFVVIVGVGGTAVFALDVINKIKKDAKKGESSSAKSALQNLMRKGIKPTITEAQAKGFVSQIIASAQDFGTDEAAFYRIFNTLKNDADLYLLISVFGVQEWKGTFTSWFGNESGTLSYLLSYELNSSEIKSINELLAKNGINYKF